MDSTVSILNISTACYSVPACQLTRHSIPGILGSSSVKECLYNNNAKLHVCGVGILYAPIPGSGTHTSPEGEKEGV